MLCYIMHGMSKAHVMFAKFEASVMLVQYQAFVDLKIIVGFNSCKINYSENPVSNKGFINNT